MLSFLGRSIIQKVITLFLVSVVSFLIIHLAPGRPSQVDPMNPKFTPEVVERFRKEFHLDKPLYTQYLLFYTDLFTGKTVSWKDNQSVLKKIWERFLNSLPLFVVGTILTWTLSFPVGIRSAISRGGIYDRSATFLSYLLISIPGFFFAYLLIILVVTHLHVSVIGMETFGIKMSSWPHLIMDRVWHLLIPWAQLPELRFCPGMCAVRCLRLKAGIMCELQKPRASLLNRSITNMPCGMPSCLS